MTHSGPGEIVESRSCLEKRRGHPGKEIKGKVIKFPEMLKPKGKQFTVMEESR